MKDPSKINGYDLSRAFYDWAFENPEKVSPNHSALYFFAIEHCNRLGWKEKFGLPTTMAKEAIGIRSYNTYIKTLNELVDFGFIKLIERSKNQYSSNIVALSNFDKAHNKALDKALIKHGTKQEESTEQSICSIIKQINKEQINKEQLIALKNAIDEKLEKLKPSWALDFVKSDFKEIVDEFIDHRIKMQQPFETAYEVQNFYNKLLPMSGHDAKKAGEIVKNAIQNSWKTVYPLNEKDKKQEKPTHNYMRSPEQDQQQAKVHKF